MKKMLDRFLNIVLYPASFFERLTEGKATLLAGILMVGAIDLLLPDVGTFIRNFFNGKTAPGIAVTAVLALLLIALLGFIDVLFISVPLFDFSAYLKKKEVEQIQDAGMEIKADVKHTASPVKIMKVYIMSHFIIVPVTVLAHYAFLKDFGENSPGWLQNLVLVYLMVILLWSAAILARGINTLFRFNPIYGRLSLIVVFAWNFLFSMVFDMQIMNWLLKMFSRIVSLFPFH